MPEISLLPDHLIDQIAAGEVIERPASIVKELVENALDAESTRVDVAITLGGIRGIRVVDDGVGMEPDDAIAAFQRHATSKLRSVEDLERVGTLGFRGEALPSIAAVARTRLCTRRENATVGVEIRREPGEATGTSVDWSGPVGTRVEVAEVFGSVPARRKFLKTPATESGHVTRWLERVALARPDVQLSLERDGRAAIQWLATRDLRERVIAVLPPGIGERMREVSGRDSIAEVSGLASPTDLMRGHTGDVHLFVNGRPVRDPVLLHAVREAYRDALPPGRHPAVVLYLRIDPDQVDVNVHPAKWEVRFRDPFGARRLVRESLMRAIGRRPAPTAAAGQGFVPAAGQRIAPGPATTTRLGDPPLPLHAFDAASASAPFAAAGRGPDRPFASHRYVGQVLGTYLVLESPESVLLLDQHAAHERVVFERLRLSWLGGKLERQALLIPAFSEVSRGQAELLERELAAFERAGIELEIGQPTARGGVRVGVRSVPALLARGRARDWGELVESSLAALRDSQAGETRDGIDRALHDLLATAACHAAARKGDRLDPREVQGLLEGLDEIVWVPNCPHGRPLMSVLGQGELERRFLRA